MSATDVGSETAIGSRERFVGGQMNGVAACDVYPSGHFWAGVMAQDLGEG